MSKEKDSESPSSGAESAASDTAKETEDSIEEYKDSPENTENAEDKKDTESDTTGNVEARSHANRLLDTILDEPAAPTSRHFRHHMAYDLLLALGLLVAVGGFTTGMMKIYITHMAKQSITQGNYKAAINILKRNPVPEFFSGSGTADDAPQELLNRALYLDAMDKLDNDKNDQSALKQLEQITPGSQYFNVAQEILKARTPASSLQLEGGASQYTRQQESVQTPANEKLFKESNGESGAESSADSAEQ
ncbi:MAG: hypothetical protein KC777_04220 [Cyanobacteria bacterium HKST-UBA02]|nr:hypothetical protein [Cyanobacteria bacterium HKST-UBA02]